MTNIIQPKRRGMPPFVSNKPVIRLSDYGRNAILYFYMDAVRFIKLQRGEGVRVLETGGTYYLHIIRNDENNVTGYKIGGRNKFSLTAQLSGQSGVIPEGLWTIQDATRHPEFHLIVYPLKYEHR